MLQAVQAVEENPETYGHKNFGKILEVSDDQFDKDMTG
jgi:hypothetical protein